MGSQNPIKEDIMQVSNSYSSAWSQMQNYQNTSTNAQQSRSQKLSDEMFSTLDTDSSGLVDESEFTSLIEELTNAGSEDIASAFANIDSDSDGSITQSELASAIESSMPPPPMMGGMPPPMQSTSEEDDSTSEDDIFAQFDTNGDGTVSQEELLAGLESMKPQKPQKMSSEQIFDKLLQSNTQATQSDQNSQLSSDVFQKSLMSYIQNSAAMTSSSSSIQSFSA
jgi:Ca2+-binding EF-hand superfamily protein